MTEAVKDKLETTEPKQKENIRAVWAKTDVIERAEDIVLVSDVPGAHKDSLEIVLEKNVLDIKATADLSHCGCGATQTRYETSFTLSDKLDREGITAKIDAGVLRIVIPKAKESKTHRIKIAG